VLFEERLSINANFMLMHDLLTYYKQLWNLEDDGEPFGTLCSLLQPVRYRNTDCMLKIVNADEGFVGII
jgi:streptomycin 6-kinase